MFWKAQGSINDQELQKTFLEMRSKGYVEAADYLERIEDCIWTLHQWAGKGAITYGQRTSNPSEIINSALLQERHMPMIGQTPCRNRLNMLRHNKERDRRRERVQETETEAEAEAETAAEGSQWRRRRRKKPGDRGIGRGSRDK